MRMISSLINFLSLSNSLLIDYPRSMGGKGMQLGKKSMQASLLETLKNEEGVREMAPQESISQQNSARQSSILAPSAQQQSAPNVNEEA
jgi:hypothetical protein